MIRPPPNPQFYAIKHPISLRHAGCGMIACPTLALPLRSGMFRRRILLAPLGALALAAISASLAQVPEAPAHTPTGAALPFEAAPATTIEPQLLPGNIPVAFNEQMPAGFDPATIEPALPEAEASAPEASGPAVEEVAAIPRRFRYEIGVEVRGIYSDTVGRQSLRNGVFYTQIAPSVNLALGERSSETNYVFLTYSPSYSLFEDSRLNELEHTAATGTRWRGGRLTINVAQSFRSSQNLTYSPTGSENVLEDPYALDVRGRQLRIFTTAVDADYALGGKTSLHAMIDYAVRDAESAIGSTALEGSAGVDYSFSPKMKFGAGAGFGHDFVDSPGDDRQTQHYYVRSTYDPSGKLTATGSAGVRVRETNDSAYSHVSPDFSLALSYQPFGSTRFGLAASTQTYSAASNARRDFTSTRVGATVAQQLWRRLSLSLALAYYHQEYTEVRRTDDKSVREDNYYSVAPALNFALTRFWHAGVFYSYRQHDSNGREIDFTSNQFGVSTGVSF